MLFRSDVGVRVGVALFVGVTVGVAVDEGVLGSLGGAGKGSQGQSGSSEDGPDGGLCLPPGGGTPGGPPPGGGPAEPPSQGNLTGHMGPLEKETTFDTAYSSDFVYVLLSLFSRYILYC